jgi:hypothetical protein
MNSVASSFAARRYAELIASVASLTVGSMSRASPSNAETHSPRAGSVIKSHDHVTAGKPATQESSLNHIAPVAERVSQLLRDARTPASQNHPRGPTPGDLRSANARNRGIENFLNFKRHFLFVVRSVCRSIERWSSQPSAHALSGARGCRETYRRCGIPSLRQGERIWFCTRQPTVQAGWVKSRLETDRQFFSNRGLCRTRFSAV